MGASTVVKVTRDGEWVQVSADITAIKYMRVLPAKGRDADVVGTLVSGTVSPAASATGMFVTPGDTIAEAQSDLIGGDKLYGRVYSGYGDLYISVGA
jgi:hypothetical protein